MATTQTFHSGLSLVSQTGTSFPPSTPATSLLLGRAKPGANSCFSTPSSFEHCSSPLHVLVRAAGSKESAVRSVEIPAIEYHEEELPPLLASMTIAGLPPCQESMFADEALSTILQSGPSDLFGAYYHVCNSYTSFVYCGAVSSDRLATISTVVTLLTIVVDILLDKQDGLLLEKLGIDPNILGSPELIREYLNSLEALVRQENPPQSPDRIQEMAWKLGCDFRKLSNPEWFDLFSGALHDFINGKYEGYCADLVGDRTNITDLEAFTQMRSTVFLIATLSVEFCNEAFLTIEVREHPAVQQLTRASWRYTAYVNDIFSFSKESIHEPHNSYNLIKVLMQSEGLSLPQAARRALDLTNSIAQDFMELETQLPVWAEEPWTSLVRSYAEGLKEFMVGTTYWHSRNKRYRDPKAPFPELRDVNVPFNTKADTVKIIRQ